MCRPRAHFLKGKWDPLIKNLAMPLQVQILDVPSVSLFHGYCVRTTEHLKPCQGDQSRHWCQETGAVDMLPGEGGGSSIPEISGVLLQVRVLMAT